jgi:4,5-dihydroxyphthalate decarboxylase
MSEDRLRLTFAGLDYLDRTRALVDGSVQPDGIELDCVQMGPYELFQRVAQKVEFDVAEMSASTYMSLVSQGDDRYVGLPVFLSRHFRHGYIFVNGACDVREPGDLVGRRVGVPEYEMTAALWQRAILQHDYGVRPDQLTWVQGGEFRPGFVERQKTPLPPEITIEFAPEDRTLHDMVATGEIDAVMCPHRPAAMGDGSGRVRRLFPDYAAIEKEYYRRTGFFPIMHLTLLRRDLYEAHPEVAVALVEAFAEAKRRGWQRMLELGGLAVMLPWLTEEIEEISAVMGPDHWRYGFKENHEILGAMCRYSFEQGLSVRALDPEELFAPVTHSLSLEAPTTAH